MQALSKICLKSDDQQKYSVSEVQKMLLKDKFDHKNFEPRQFDERARSSYIHMLGMHTAMDMRNQQASVTQMYPKFANIDRNLMTKTEKKEMKRLARLCKFQDTLPEFVREELSLEEDQQLVQARLQAREKERGHK